MSTDSRWKVGMYRRDGAESLAVWQIDIVEGEKGHPVCLISPAEKRTKDDEANAHLIAAAPELYEALDELVRVIDGTLQGYGMLESPLQKAAEVLKSSRGER